MKERPIIMSGDNPRLILEGRKTQTRRGRFVLTSEIQPPENRTVACKNGISHFFGAWSTISGWVLCANGREEKLDGPPEAWWLTDDMANELRIPTESLGPEPYHGPAQLALTF